MGHPVFGYPYFRYCILSPLILYHVTVTVALACFLHYPPNVPMAVFFTVAAAFHSAIVIVCFTNLSSRRRFV